MPLEDCERLDLEKSKKTLRYTTLIAIGIAVGVGAIGYFLSLGVTVTLLFAGILFFIEYEIFSYYDDKHPDKMYLKEIKPAEVYLVSAIDNDM